MRTNTDSFNTYDMPAMSTYTSQLLPNDGDVLLKNKTKTFIFSERLK